MTSSKNGATAGSPTSWRGLLLATPTDMDDGRAKRMEVVRGVLVGVSHESMPAKFRLALGRTVITCRSRAIASGHSKSLVQERKPP